MNKDGISIECQAGIEGYLATIIEPYKIKKAAVITATTFTDRPTVDTSLKGENSYPCKILIIAKIRKTLNPIKPRLSHDVFG